MNLIGMKLDSRQETQL